MSWVGLILTPNLQRRRIPQQSVANKLVGTPLVTKFAAVVGIELRKSRCHLYICRKTASEPIRATAFLSLVGRMRPFAFVAYVHTPLSAGGRRDLRDRQHEFFPTPSRKQCHVTVKTNATSGSQSQHHDFGEFPIYVAVSALSPVSAKNLPPSLAGGKTHPWRVWMQSAARSDSRF